MPENGESTKFTINASALNPTIMATAEVGGGSGRTIANGSSKLPIHTCGCQLFIKVGGSKTTREHQSTNNSEVLLAEHNLQI
jgi:hypothetical protein